jgi:hypothetical protein
MLTSGSVSECPSPSRDRDSVLSRCGNTPEATPRRDLRPTSGKSAAYPREPMNSVVDSEPKSKSTLDRRLIAGVLVGEKYVPCAGEGLETCREDTSDKRKG